MRPSTFMGHETTNGDVMNAMPQQMPAAKPAPEAPDPQTRPLDYINHVLSAM